MDYPRFTTEQAAAVAGASVNTVATWLRRGIISSHPGGSDVPADVISPGTGRGRLFTRRSVLHIAMVARLTRTGFSVEAASMCASKFLDAPTFCGGEVDRQPGQFFDEGGTFLVVDITDERWHMHAIMRKDEAAKRVFMLQAYSGNPVLLLDIEEFVRSADNELKKV